MTSENPDEGEAEIQQIIEGRDSIVLDEDLVADESDSEAQDAPARLERREALPARIRKMPVAERFKLALRGNLEARNVLARDPLKLVQSAVLKNPRITVEEVVTLAKSRSVDGDLLRQLGAEKEWVRHYTVRQSLVQNPNRMLARSKNVPGVIQQAARRLVLQRER